MSRLLLVILIMAVLETEWALFAGETGLNLLLFYAVLVAASAVFWVPRLVGERQTSPETKG